MAWAVQKQPKSKSDPKQQEVKSNSNPKAIRPKLAAARLLVPPASGAAHAAGGVE